MATKSQEFGEYQNSKLICNCAVEIANILYPLRQLNYDNIAMVCVHILFGDGNETTLFLKTWEMSAHTIKELDRRIYIPNNGRFDAWLHQRLHEKMENEKENKRVRGYCLDQPGLYKLPEKGYCYMLGDQLLGKEIERIYPIDTIFRVETLENHQGALKNLCETFHSGEMMLGIAFVAATLVRSGILETGGDWQAVLYIVGKQGVGKTTLARFLTNWLKNKETGNPATFHGIGSSIAAMRDSMTAARDLPVVIDDLCLSASRNTQKKAIELGAQLIREGTNAAAIIKKKPGGQTLELKCQSGLIFTAEFILDNPSDITRCIFLNLQEPLNLALPLNTTQLGSAIQYYLHWFTTHAEQAFASLKEALNQKPGNLPPRIQVNYTILGWALQQFLSAAVSDGLSQEKMIYLMQQYQNAEQNSIQFQQNILKQYKSHIKKENIASLLLKAVEDKQKLRLTKKAHKLKKCDGILWESDLCLKKDALERFVRMQNGYQNYTISQIVRELKDIGALALQENNTAQVKLRKDLPRVYRIKMGVLKTEAREF